MSTEPLRTILLPVALLAFAAAAQAWIDGADTRAIVAAVLGVLIAAATELARRLVIPEVKLRRERLKRKAAPPEPEGWTPK